MGNTTVNPSNARKNFYQLLKDVNNDHKEIQNVKNDLKKINHSHLRKKFNEIIQTLKENPFALTQSFEKLQSRSVAFYSRGINHQHRVVYKVDEDAQRIDIYSA